MMKNLLIAILMTLIFPVVAMADTATLTWDAPTTNADPTTSCLTDLSKYNIYSSNVSGTYTTPWVRYADGLACVDTGVDAGTGCGNTFECTFVSPDLAAGTWYFSVTAEDTSGNASDPSNEVMKALLDIYGPSVIIIKTIQ